jgi:hypothetical protein
LCAAHAGVTMAAMSQHSCGGHAEAGRSILSRRTRRILERLAGVVCPPDLAERGLTRRVVADVELHLACLTPLARRTVGPALRLFDHAARIRPESRGRRFLRLDDARADAYVRAVLYGRTGPLATAVRLVKGLVVMCYYEQPEVKADLGYDPASYVAFVTARRLVRYGPQIRAAQVDGRNQ